mmetsp:Transcript_3137/g.7070  ORF Transcript_3137/g.7070 Transcript_3137/m.7070 type:complete len:337 (+) Transcript_3137:115-1125(+)|eukprot:CAMPEP_0178416220 /NCGR_PEP_ID=MMETSP0689_2-20121128/23952_1 /TAXON_ID=160604 /ORGANISM="Amphidinium massartii, Strain CS-259" /LENGTH=336 /DNA_ID=CAMNT_0020037559 /DNA_START=46 /DNA_END=1056 /DNA_ORIENTATION=-
MSSGGLCIPLRRILPRHELAKDVEARRALRNRRPVEPGENDVESASLLKEAFDRRWQETDARYQRMLQEKDDACSAWYAAQRQEIKEFEASMVIVQAVLRWRQKKHSRKVVEEKAEFARQRAEFAIETARVKAEYLKEKEKLEEDYQEAAASHQSLLSDRRKDGERLLGDVEVLERQLALKQQESKELHDQLENAVANLERQYGTNIGEQKHALEVGEARAAELEVELAAAQQRFREREASEAAALRRDLEEHARKLLAILPPQQEPPPGFEKLATSAEASRPQVREIARRGVSPRAQIAMPMQLPQVTESWRRGAPASTEPLGLKSLQAAAPGRK